jgi:hypothetical protein
LLPPTATLSPIALMMEAARTTETLVNFYQTTRCYNTEDSHLRTHLRENLKSNLLKARATLKNTKLIAVRIEAFVPHDVNTIRISLAMNFSGLN